MKIKLLLGFIAIMGGLAFMLRDSPRVLSDAWHTDFVPAERVHLTDYRCTNWNGFMFNECTVKYKSIDGTISGELMDFRFGRAPSGPVKLLQRGNDSAALTTNVSLSTVTNRAIFALIMAMFGLMILFGAFKVVTGTRA